MERTKLIAARLAKGQRENRRLSQQTVADEIGCSREAYILWERGKSTPQGHWLNKLLEYYEVSDPRDLDIFIAPRRQVLQMIAGAGAVGVLMSFGNTELAPEEFLIQCNAATAACWQLLSINGTQVIEDVLRAYIPTISSLIMRPSHVQLDAASLGVQIKLLQIVLVSRKLDYGSRELLCKEAVRLAKLSGKNALIATALEWQADTYTTCYRDSPMAIDILKDGMGYLNSDTPLTRSALCSNLAIAYAQDESEKDDKKARSYIEQARKAIPKYPELDPLYQCVDYNLPVLDGREGKVFLELAKRFPGSDYAQRAYDAFDLSIQKQITSQARLSQHLIRKAEAACLLGDFRHYAECLREAIKIAHRIDSKKQQQGSQVVLEMASEKWRKERAYQDLAKMF